MDTHTHTHTLTLTHARTHTHRHTHTHTHAHTYDISSVGPVGTVPAYDRDVAFPEGLDVLEEDCEDR
jgi:hypothetical protein